MGVIAAGPDDPEFDEDAALDDLAEVNAELADGSANPDDPDGPTYEELQEQIERLQAAVKRNNSELAKRRQVQTWMAKHGITDFDAWAAQMGIDPTTGQRTAAPAPVAPAAEPAAEVPAADPAPEPPATAPEPAAPVDSRLRELESKLERGSIRSERLEAALRNTAIESALRGARYSGSTERALRLINMDAVTVNDDGTVAGVDTEVEGLMKEFPEMFGRRPAATAPASPPPPRPARGAETADGGDKARPPARPKRWDQMIADQIGR